MKARLAAIATWTGGVLHGADPCVRGVSIDSRRTAPGALFVALPGTRVDGHDYAAAAQAAGAAAALVRRRLPLVLPQVVVDDPARALADIARAWLRRCPARRLAITGSNGKTTVKTLTASILAQTTHTHASAGNLNNELGLPLSVLGLTPQHEHAVFEMGCGAPGDIRALCAIAPPHLALVNNVGPAHLERLGSLAVVAATKAEIYQDLPPGGTAVLPADDPYIEALDRAVPAQARRLRFGLHEGADVRASAVSVAAETAFVLHLGARSAPVRLRLHGLHNVRNALAAAALAWAAGSSVEAIVAGLEATEGVPGRGSEYRLARGAVLIDDSYNANPASLRAGIDAVRARAARVWLALGDMAELGPEAERLHYEVGVHARAAGCERVYAVGDLMRHLVRGAGDIGRHFATLEALIAELEAQLPADAHLLVKGSRSAGMERVVQALRDAAAGGS